ncbi:MAG: hypothetical protein IPG10_17345 [Flavobacteriales bacterium]|nr:hypothetical protein [Flavobacteriales bacterium]MBK7753789.1 hypothetical protein [Flavobacteriales bacterium]
MPAAVNISAIAVAPILEAVFIDDARVYERYSKHETALLEFESAQILLAYIQTERDSGQTHFSFDVYYPKANGRVGVRRIQLRPEKNDGATWRESIEGWGLIGLNLRFDKDGVVEFGIAQNSEKRAQTWADIPSGMGLPELWDWQIVEKHGRRLLRLLKKASEK